MSIAVVNIRNIACNLVTCCMELFQALYRLYMYVQSVTVGITYMYSYVLLHNKVCNSASLEQAVVRRHMKAAYFCFVIRIIHGIGPPTVLCLNCGM